MKEEGKCVKNQVEFYKSAITKNYPKFADIEQ